MAERRHAPGRHEELQARGEEREDQDFGSDRQEVRAGHEGQCGHDYDHARHDEALGAGEDAPGAGRDDAGGARHGGGAAEEPVGPHHENERHDDEDEHQRDGGQDQNAERVEFRHEEGRHESATDAAESADHHDHECLDDDRQVHRMADGIARDLQGTAESREEDAEREDAGEKPFLVHPECRHHVAVLGRGPYQDAEPRAVEQQHEEPEHHRPEHHEDDVVGRRELAEDRNRTLEARRAGPDEIFAAPDQQRQILDDQRHPEGREKLEEVGRRVDAAQQEHLDQRADDRHDERPDKEAAPEQNAVDGTRAVDEALRQRIGQVGAQHVEGAVGEVHDPRDAEDDR